MQAGAQGLDCLVMCADRVQERQLREPLSHPEASSRPFEGGLHTAEPPASPAEDRDGLTTTGDHDPTSPQTEQMPTNDQGKQRAKHVTLRNDHSASFEGLTVLLSPITWSET